MYSLKKPSIVLQNRDDALLSALFESRVMTAAHIAVLHFNGSGEAAKQRLRKLKIAGYLGEWRRTVAEPAALFLTKKAILLLEEKGILNEYPQLEAFSIAKRSRVSESTLRHELDVMDVKVAFHRAIDSSERYRLEQFTTWPLLCEFKACKSSHGGSELLVRPDGFFQIAEWEGEKRGDDFSYFLELDRSSEVVDLLVSKALGYFDFYRTGGFAERRGADAGAYKEYPFRVLVIVKTAERRNNIMERLLQNRPPIGWLVYLSTFEEATTNPLGAIWSRPQDYLEATRGTIYAPKDEVQKWGYKRDSGREYLVEERIRKFALLDDGELK